MIYEPVDIEKEIEKNFITGLRSVFELNSKFRYNKDNALSGVIITPEYPEKGSSFKTPHIIVTNISYQFNLQSSFFSNYGADILDDTGLKTGEVSYNNIPYSLSLICLAEYFISKDLANSAVNYISFGAKEIFDVLGLNVQNISKSATSAHSQYPEHKFETNIGVQGNLEWQGNKMNDQTILHLLERIKIIYEEE